MNAKKPIAMLSSFRNRKPQPKPTVKAPAPQADELAGMETPPGTYKLDESATARRLQRIQQLEAAYREG